VSIVDIGLAMTSGSTGLNLGSAMENDNKQKRLSPELFGPGHFVGLGLRLKSEIRTRT
jgi:hypothetical protein